LVSYIGLSILINLKSRVLAVDNCKDLHNLLACGNVAKICDLNSVAANAILLWERPILDNMSNESRVLLVG
jgi:hypothetical protein